jgi:hypothetical protein
MGLKGGEHKNEQYGTRQPALPATILHSMVRHGIARTTVAQSPDISLTLSAPISLTLSPVILHQPGYSMHPTTLNVMSSPLSPLSPTPNPLPPSASLSQRRTAVTDILIPTAQPPFPQPHGLYQPHGGYRSPFPQMTPSVS